MQAAHRHAGRARRAGCPTGAWFEADDLFLLSLSWLTPTQASAAVDGPRLPRPGARGVLHVQALGERLPALEARIESVDAERQTLELCLAPMLPELGAALASWACEAARARAQQTRAHHEALESEAERAAALRFLVESAATGWVETPQGTCELTAQGLDASTLEVSWTRSGPLPAAPFLILIEGYNALYRIPIAACRAHGDRLITARPPWLQATRSRRARRAGVAGGLNVRFDHPLWPELRLSRALLDLTRHGLSFAADEAREHVYPGLSIPRLLVETDSGESIALRAVVMSARGGRRPRFGCEVSPLSAQDAARWLSLCDARLFPGTRRGATEVWSVYRASGYFGLSETLAGAFDHLRAAYVNASRALSSAPQLGCQASWPSHGSPKATVTNLRLTPSCWFSYHLAAQPDESMSARSAQVLRDLYRQYIEHALATPGARWQMAYVQQTAHWSMRVHVDIPRRYLGRHEALVQEFRALEVRTVGRCAPPAQQLCARRAGAGEHQQALVQLQASLPAIYFDALDYAPERFSLQEFKAEWARHGLERDRELLVAFDAGELVALGVVECAEPGLHLFGLLDTLRLYAVAQRGERAFPALIDAARAWFRERGRRSFCYLEEQGEIETDGRDIKPMSPALLTLLSVDRLPEMLEHLHMDTARAEPARVLAAARP